MFGVLSTDGTRRLGIREDVASVTHAFHMNEDVAEFLGASSRGREPQKSHTPEDGLRYRLRQGVPGDRSDILPALRASALATDVFKRSSGIKQRVIPWTTTMCLCLHRSKGLSERAKGILSLCI